MKQRRMTKTVHIAGGMQCNAPRNAEVIDPIPIRPEGYFDHVYTKAELAEENELAKASVVRAPVDIE